MASDFADRMRRRGEEVVAGSNRIKRLAALAIDGAVVLATPVDTGRARANWIVSIGAPVTTTTDATDPSGGRAIGEGRRAIDGAGVGDAIYIRNNLDYISRLNDGHSAQAPAGFVQSAVEVGRQVVRNSKLLEE